MAHSAHPDVDRRLARAAGHIESIRRMLSEKRTCPELLQQVKAVISALEGVRRIIVEDHISHCIHDAIEKKGAQAAIEEIEQILSQIL